MTSAVVRIRLSDFAQEFMAHALDLLQVVEDADVVLVTDEVLDAAAAFRSLVDEHSGDL